MHYNLADNICVPFLDHPRNIIAKIAKMIPYARTANFKKLTIPYPAAHTYIEIMRNNEITDTVNCIKMI